MQKRHKMKETKQKWRLILTGHNDAFFNMAVDEAIMKLHPIIQKPTIRFYGWKPAAVSIGYFQSLKDEVDVEKCNELGIDCIRRVTGGGAVFHDTEITYSIVIEHKKIDDNILKSYEKICEAIVHGLKTLGIDSKFAPINDIIVKDKKISGNAQTRREGVLLQHGTILLDTDVDKMFSILKVPDEKLKGKLIQSVKKRVTSVLRETGSCDFDQVLECLKIGFEKVFDVELEIGNLSDQEVEMTKKIIKEKFNDEGWNYMR